MVVFEPDPDLPLDLLVDTEKKDAFHKMYFSKSRLFIVVKKLRPWGRNPCSKSRSNCCYAQRETFLDRNFKQTYRGAGREVRTEGNILEQAPRYRAIPQMESRLQRLMPEVALGSLGLRDEMPLSTMPHL